ncbi:MAG: hypothetical protein OEU32_00760 [Acidimicrobiia bacterium]|nr:hypothetical protein [Acidimicrobiia bacterium]
MSVDLDLIHRYRRSTLTRDELVKVELELQRSPAWRSALNDTVDAHRLGATWAAVEGSLDAPTPSRLERAATRLGAPQHLTRIMGATPNLRRAWMVSAVVLLLFGLAVSNGERETATIALFLSIAPLVPVFGVGLVYGPGADPAHEMATVTPMGGLRLVVLRTLMALLTSLVVVGIAAVLVEERSILIAAWLLPAVALSAATLAVSSFVPIRNAAAGVAAGWLTLVVIWARIADDGVAAFRLPGQLVAAVALAVSVAVIAARRDAFSRAVSTT